MLIWLYIRSLSYYTAARMKVTMGMNKLNKLLLASLITLTVALTFPGNASADFNPSCPTVYGANCPSGQLFLNKQVRNPQTGELVESLSPNGHNFLPGQEVSFRIEVKNTGQSDLDNVRVQDKLPDTLDFISGPGNFNKHNRIIEWYINKLRPGESRLFDVKGKVVFNKEIKVSITCSLNVATAQKDQQVAQDSSSFCIQEKVLGVVKELPVTGTPKGVELLWLGYSALLITSLLLFKQIKSIERR